MALWDTVADIVNKFIPSRKAALIDEINTLTWAYSKALEENRDTDAAILHKRLKLLRRKAGITDGNV